ncbi:hypothetical protein GFS31_38450 [Leptolyngbya sp. BL0902]|uniref:DUF29 domain-containing protein n=1 Tax=Leptolyngbya sp. BL0902 TaxID=1115757 RepID=UPI0018E72590|nr:DUF29 domain-containing protein [Leptolyngbya sp. BL0902]QQE67133.1 hypothetical protein GFS31_38450 [Leptolyngbya sp. BL0902]
MPFTTPTSAVSTLYEVDFYEWLQHTVEAIKHRNFDQVDWDNLIEEVESMGRSEKRELKSRLLVILEHLLKLIFWDSEKPQNARGWRNTVIEQRNQVDLILEDSPSLKPWLAEIFVDSYAKARQHILQKSGLPGEMFPIQPPFPLENVLNTDWLPG